MSDPSLVIGQRERESHERKKCQRGRSSLHRVSLTLAPAANDLRSDSGQEFWKSVEKSLTWANKELGAVHAAHSHRDVDGTRRYSLEIVILPIHPSILTSFSVSLPVPGTLAERGCKARLRSTCRALSNDRPLRHEPDRQTGQLQLQEFLAHQDRQPVLRLRETLLERGTALRPCNARSRRNRSIGVSAACIAHARRMAGRLHG